MTEFPGATGLVLNEPLLWERGRKGRCGFSLPRRDVERAAVPAGLAGDGPDFPDLSELDVVRHYTRLSSWNFSVDAGMYPLGSCTMKYNPKTNERQAAVPGFAHAHPLLPAALCQGGLELMAALECLLAEITGMDAVTLQPGAGAHGELAGMLIFHAYHRHLGKPRSKIIVPDTAHGTNPASAALCGYAAVPIASSARGVLAPETVAAVMDEETAGIMVTNPNTLGLFEENIKAVAEIVHAKGGLVYGDGANMNAVMGRGEHERDRHRRAAPQPAQNLRDPPRRGRPGRRAGLRAPAPGAVPAGAAGARVRRDRTSCPKTTRCRSASCRPSGATWETSSGPTATS